MSLRARGAPYEVFGDEQKSLSWKSLFSFLLAFLFIFFLFLGSPFFWWGEGVEGNLSIKQTETTQAMEQVSMKQRISK